MEKLVKVVGHIGFADMALFAYVFASLNSIYQVVCCGYLSRYKALDFKELDCPIVLIWVVLFFVSFWIDISMSSYAYKEYDDDEDRKEFANVIVFSVVSNSIAWIANSIYLSVFLFA